MTDSEQYKEHIEYTFNAYCKVVIRHAAIDTGRLRRYRLKREISLEYLTEERYYPLSVCDEYFAPPEPLGGHPVVLCGQTVTLHNERLATALLTLPELKREMIYLYFFQRYTHKEIGSRYGRSHSTAGFHIRKAVWLLRKEMEVSVYDK